MRKILLGALCAVTLCASMTLGAEESSKRVPVPAASLLGGSNPSFGDLTSQQRLVLAPFASQWNDMPLIRKRQWLSLAERFPQMSAEQQARAHERIREWAALSIDERRLARANYRLVKHLPADSRTAEAQQYDTMTDEQKHVLRAAGKTSNTAARHAGSRTALAKEAAKPFPRRAAAIDADAPAKPQ